MTPTTAIILDTRRKKNNGEYPVKLRVTFLMEQRYYRTKFSYTKEEFNQVITAPNRAQKTANIEMSVLEKKATDIIGQLPNFSFNSFNALWENPVKLLSDVFSVYDSYIADLKTRASIKTVRTYESSLNSLKKFKSKLSFWDITPGFLNAYQNSLIKEGKSITTVGIYVRNLRSVYNEAIARGIRVKGVDYPFGKKKYVIPKGVNVKKALSKNQVKLIFDYQPLNKMEERAKDFWLLSYLCNGMNFKDIALLKNKNIDGRYIRFERAKTVKSLQENPQIVSCYLTEPAIAIILKWKKKTNDPEDFIFEIVNNDDNEERSQAKIDQFVKINNKYTKQISKNIKLPVELTTYFARHSFATIQRDSGASIEYVSEALGHSNIKTTQNYLASFDNDTKQKMARALIDFESSEEGKEVKDNLSSSHSN